jgi:hypothetical protein
MEVTGLSGSILRGACHGGGFSLRPFQSDLEMILGTIECQLDFKCEDFCCPNVAKNARRVGHPQNPHFSQNRRENGAPAKIPTSRKTGEKWGTRQNPHFSQNRREMGHP